jgi:hypothetical protein
MLPIRFLNQRISTFLLVVNTWYQRGTDFRSQIDHIMVRKTWLSAIHDTRVYRGAEFSNSDHRLVVSEMKLQLSTQKKPAKTCIELENFKSEKQTEFQLLLENRFHVLGGTENGMCDWEVLKSAVNEEALKVCGRLKHKRVEWLTDDKKQLAALKLAKFKEWQSLQHGDVKKSEVYDEYRKLNRESGNIICQSWAIIAKYFTLKKLYWLNQVIKSLAVLARILRIFFSTKPNLTAWD